jgi:hypothetical protein
MERLKIIMNSINPSLMAVGAIALALNNVVGWWLLVVASFLMYITQLSYKPK